MQPEYTIIDIYQIISYSGVEIQLIWYKLITLYFIPICFE